MGLFSPVWRLRLFVPRDVLVLVFWRGRSPGEGFYSVEGDGVFPGPVGQDVYALVSRYGAEVHVARDGGGRQPLAQGRCAWGGAGRVMVLTPGVVNAVRGDVYGEGSDGALEFVGLDFVEARHHPCVGAPFADPHGVCPRRRWVQAVRGDARDRAVVGGIGHSGGGGADAGEGVVVVEPAGLAPRIVSVLGLLGGGVHTCVFGLLVGAVCCVEGGGPGGGVVEGGVWEVPPCCPCVQGGRRGPFRLYGVSLVVSATGDEDVGGSQLIHLCGVGEVAGDGDLGGVVLAGGGVGDDVVGRPFVLGGVFHRVQLEWGVERLRCSQLFLGLRVGRHFGFDQVLWAPGFRGPYLCGCRCCGLEEGGCVGVYRGGGKLVGG